MIVQYTRFFLYFSSPYFANCKERDSILGIESCFGPKLLLLHTLRSELTSSFYVLVLQYAYLSPGIRKWNEPAPAYYYNFLFLLARRQQAAAASRNI